MAHKATRSSFGETIAKLAEKDSQIVVLDADLGKSTMTGEFAKKFPDRYFEFGIAEQNMIGTASGLALGGKTPFAASFACFLVGRYETIRMSVSYSIANVKLVGTHAGIGIGEDGYSQMGVEDIALLRSLPNFTILQPADDREAQAAVTWASIYKGPVYLRFTRQKVQDVHDDHYQFKFGKGDILKTASPAKESSKPRVAIFATGGVVYNSLKAAEDLEKEGILSTVVNIHTIKPLDEALVLELARTHKNIVTVEDHSIIGGLGSAVSETVAESGIPTKVLRLGVKEFGYSGSPEDLYENFGFSIPKLKQSILSFLK